MQKLQSRIILLLIFFIASYLEAKISYNSLDPTSIAEHLAYYELYRDTPEGKDALAHAWKLLSGCEGKSIPLSFPRNINAFIALINPTNAEECPTLNLETAVGPSQKVQDFESESLVMGAEHSQAAKAAPITSDYGSKDCAFRPDPTVVSRLNKEALEAIEEVAGRLPNRKLKGRNATSVKELLALPEEEIDLGRALLLTQLNEDKEKIRYFEAILDLMALQLLAREPQNKVQALNQLIFYELGFRFPPHSSYSGAIDRFTFLPQVLESRRGVCLGVSALYLCLAQRVGLAIEIITPPGHIFVRVNDTNIETTLRGVHIHDDEYLGINLRSLPKRSLKEVIGMAFYNQASLYLAQSNFEKAKECYLKALPFMPNDAMLKTLYGSCLFLTGQEREARKILLEAKSCPQPHQLCQDPLVDDILQNRVDKESLIPFFMYVDETPESIEEKKEALVQSLKRCPTFRSGRFQLAICYLQQHHPQQAILALEEYHKQDPSDITVEYYLAELSFTRYDAERCWKHLKNAESIANIQGYTPKALERLKLTLSCQSPQPLTTKP